MRPVDDYPHELPRDPALIAPARRGGDPAVVLLTPGVYNSAYFEHTFLAQQMGVELVEGRDLVVHGNRVYMRTTSGLQRVDVIYRRIDDDFLDPLAFRPDSPARRAGPDRRLPRGPRRRWPTRSAPASPTTRRSTRTCPTMIRYYLGEEPLLAERADLPRRPTTQRPRVHARAPRRAGGQGGQPERRLRHADRPAVDRRRARASSGAGSRPTRASYIAQPTLALSRHPTFVDGGLDGRHVDLRPFVLSGASVHDRPRRADPRRTATRARWSSTPRRAAAPRTPGCCATDAEPRRRVAVLDGRYIERAENIARLLDVDFHGSSTAHVAEGEIWQRLVARSATTTPTRALRRRPPESVRRLAALTPTANPNAVVVLHRSAPARTPARCARRSPPRCGRRSTRSTSAARRRTAAPCSRRPMPSTSMCVGAQLSRAYRRHHDPRRGVRVHPARARTSSAPRRPSRLSGVRHVVVTSRGRRARRPRADHAAQVVRVLGGLPSATTGWVAQPARAKSSTSSSPVFPRVGPGSAWAPPRARRLPGAQRGRGVACRPGRSGGAGAELEHRAVDEVMQADGLADVGNLLAASTTPKTKQGRRTTERPCPSPRAMLSRNSSSIEARVLHTTRSATTRRSSRRTWRCG